jgi:hypothetical protein
MLRGYGEVHHADNDRPRTFVGINIVTRAVRVDGQRVWVSSTAGDDSGWLDARDVSTPVPQGYNLTAELYSPQSGV